MTRYARSPRPTQRRLEVAKSLQVKLFVFIGQIAHRRVVDRRSDLDQLTENLIRDRRLQPFETVVGRLLLGSGSSSRCTSA